MVDREDNSRALRLELKEQDKSAYGVINLLSMDTNADVYDRTDTQFLHLVKDVASDARGSQESREVYLSRILYHRRRIDVG